MMITEEYYCPLNGSVVRSKPTGRAAPGTLGTRSVKVLRLAGVKGIGWMADKNEWGGDDAVLLQVAELTSADLLEQKGCGQGGLKEISDWLGAHGLRLND